MTARGLLLIGLLVLLAACGVGTGDDDPIPTRFELPDATGEASPTATVPAPTEVASVGQTPPESTVTTPSATSALTSTPTVFETATVTPSATITDTPTATVTAAPTATRDLGPVDFLAEIARSATVLPPGFVPGGTPPTPTISLPTLGPPGIGATPTPAPGTVLPPTCQYLPPGGFGQLVLNRPDLLAAIGCPLGTPPDTLALASAEQSFQGGAMIWLDDGPPGEPGFIYVLYDNGTFQRFVDTYVEGEDPESGGETPPDGFFAPVRGFGKVWREQPTVRDTLGWATDLENGTTATVQNFDNGRMLALPTRGDTVVLIYQGSPASGTWQSAPVGF